VVEEAHNPPPKIEVGSATKLDDEYIDSDDEHADSPPPQ